MSYESARNQEIRSQNIRTSHGETRDYMISVVECRFDNNPPTEEHEIVVIDEEPAIGIPALRLCE